MPRRLFWVCVAGLAACGIAAGGPPAAQTAPADAAPDDLAFAAACLDRGEETAAAAHLIRHVAVHPDQPLVRISLAELLWRRNRQAEAGVEYERFLNDTDASANNVSRMVQAHVRLVALAEQSADRYGEHLHRGIGLYLLAGKAADTDAAQGLLCKAAGELALAVRDHPAEARPHWYLHLAWARLAQSQPAERHLRRAAALAAFGDLPAAEQRDLALAVAMLAVP